MQQQDERQQESGLQPGLKQRHMTMIALGGVIGAGLFVGSGMVSLAAILLAYVPRLFRDRRMPEAAVPAGSDE